jgi:hypothetical protein
MCVCVYIYILTYKKQHTFNYMKQAKGNQNSFKQKRQKILNKQLDAPFNWSVTDN